MPDQTTSQSEGGQSSHRSTRQQKRPTRRRADQGSAHLRTAGESAAPSASASSRQDVPREQVTSRQAAASNRAATGGHRTPAQRASAEAAKSLSREHRAVAAQANGREARPRTRAAHPAARSQAIPAPAAPPTIPPQSGYAGYAQAVGFNPRVAPAQKLKGQMATYSDMNRYKNRKRKKASFVGVIAALVILAAIGAGAYFYLNPPTFNVTVNGMTRTVNQGTTVAALVQDGVVNVNPGNLVDVEGVVLEEGAGDTFSGTVNGVAITDPTMTLHKGDAVQLGNGADKMEDYTAETIVAEPGYRELGQGSLHVYVPGIAGQAEKRTGLVSGKVADEVIQPVQDNIYFKYNASPDEKVVALTFDDGPWETTPQLLDVLKENDAKATFFTIGFQVPEHPDTVKRAFAEGHQICTHSWDHARGAGHTVDLTLMSTEEQIDEIQKGIQIIADTTGVDASTIIRSPGGNYHGDIIWTLQPYVTGEIGWNIDTGDWQTPGVNAIAQSVMSAKSGDVILMHDGGGSRTQTIDALKIALPYLKEQGFKFVTIDELLAYDDPAALAAAAVAAADGAQG